MAFCSSCGTQLEDSKAFCPNCGAKVGAPNPQAPNQQAFNQQAPNQQTFNQQAPNQQAPGQSTQQKLEETFKNLNNTPDTTSEFDPADIEQNKVMAILAYIGILVLIPLFAAKDSKYAKYHTNQGFTLFLVNIAAGVVSTILGLVPILGALIVAVISICCLAFMVVGIINAASGKAKELPIIGKYTLLNK